MFVDWPCYETSAFDLAKMKKTNGYIPEPRTDIVHVVGNAFDSLRHCLNGAASIRSMGSAFDSFSAGKEPRGQVGARRRARDFLGISRGAAAARPTRAWVKKVLPGAAAAAAVAVCMPGRARGATLPTTLPTSTKFVYLSSEGYSGTIPTEFGQLTNVEALLLQR